MQAVSQSASLFNIFHILKWLYYATVIIIIIAIAGNDEFIGLISVLNGLQFHPQLYVLAFTLALFILSHSHLNLMTKSVTPLEDFARFTVKYQTSLASRDPILSTTRPSSSLSHRVKDVSKLPLTPVSSYFQDFEVRPVTLLPCHD